VVTLGAIQALFIGIDHWEKCQRWYAQRDGIAGLSQNTVDAMLLYSGH
jgi:hypothetical protein